MGLDVVAVGAVNDAREDPEAEVDAVALEVGLLA